MLKIFKAIEFLCIDGIQVDCRNPSEEDGQQPEPTQHPSQLSTLRHLCLKGVVLPTKSGYSDLADILNCISNLPVDLTELTLSLAWVLPLVPGSDFSDAQIKRLITYYSWDILDSYLVEFSSRSISPVKVVVNILSNIFMITPDIMLPRADARVYGMYLITVNVRQSGLDVQFVNSIKDGQDAGPVRWGIEPLTADIREPWNANVAYLAGEGFNFEKDFPTIYKWHQKLLEIPGIKASLAENLKAR
ncbi:hypothetical protein EUX98_g9026, partial [Antrodiella citrinella]